MDRRLREIGFLTQIVGIMVNRRHLTGDFFERHKQGDVTLAVMV